MNTATRVIDARKMAMQKAAKAQPWRVNISVVVLVAAVLLSAFALVYVKDLNRRLFIQYQSLQQQKNHYNLTWSKLLLEQSTWSTQARVQQIAEKLGMIIPKPKNIILVRE